MGMQSFDWATRVPRVARAGSPIAASAPVESEAQWSKGLVVGGISRAGVRVDEKTTLSIPATLQALRVLSGVFAMTPMHLYRKAEGGREHLADAPAEILLAQQANSHQSAFEFFELAMGDLLLAGNFYAYVSRNRRGDPVALTRLKPGHVQVAEFFDRAEGQILFYDASLPDGSHERFPARDIWHVKGFSRDGINGLNPVHFARDALGGAIATADHASRFWSRGGRPSTVLQSEKRIDWQDKARVRDDWKALYSGFDGETVAVLDQDLKAQFLSHDMRSSQFIETREFQVVDLARIFGVPPHLIFDLSRSTNNNIEQQSLEFVIYHLGPHYRRFATAATRQFAGTGTYFEHLTDALVRADLKSRMEALWLQRQMGTLNANEIRRMQNDKDIPGAAGSEYWRPGNMGVAGQPAPQPGVGAVSIQPKGQNDAE